MSRVNYGNDIVTSGLVLSLDSGNPSSFDGNSSTWRDLSNNTTGGTLMNSVGYSNGSLVFDGIDDYIISTVLITDSYSTSIWIKSTGDNNVHGLVTINNDNNKIRGLVLTSIGGVNVYYGEMKFKQYLPINYNDSQYHNIVAIWDGSTDVRLYIDSVQKTLGGELTSGQIPNNTNKVGIGTILSTTPYYYKGNISNVQIYNRALSASEVLQNYNAMKFRYQ